MWWTLLPGWSLLLMSLLLMPSLLLCGSAQCLHRYAQRAATQEHAH